MRTIVFQEPVSSSSQSCPRRSPAAHLLKTRHFHCVSWSLYPHVKHPHVALSTEVCDLPRLFVLDEQADLISSLCDFGNAQERTRHLANFQDDPAALTLIRSPSHRPLASLKDGALWKMFPDFDAELGFSGIRSIMFPESAFASAPLLTTAEIITIPFLFRSPATCSRIMSVSSSHSDPRTVPRLSRHARRLEHCWRFHDLQVTTVHPASLNASRNLGGEHIKQESLLQKRLLVSSSSVQQPFSLVSSPSGASSSKSSTHPSLVHNLAA